MFKRKSVAEKYLGSGVEFLDGNYLYTEKHFIDFLQSQGFEINYTYVGHEREGVRIHSIFRVKKDGKNYEIKISPYQCSATSIDKKSLKTTKNLDKAWQRHLIKTHYNYDYMLNHYYLMEMDKVEESSKEIVEYYFELLKNEAQEVVSGVIRQKLLQNDAKLKQLNADWVSMFRYSKIQNSSLIKKATAKHTKNAKIEKPAQQKFVGYDATVEQNNFNSHVQDAVVNIRRDETGELSCENCK